MLAAPFLLAFVLPLASRCLARRVEIDENAAAQKRDVNWHRCTTPYAEDVVHITKWIKEQRDDDLALLRPRSELTHMLDSRDLRADMITGDLGKRDQDITAQAPMYLGLTGEKDEEGHDILGLVDSADEAPEFQFLTCPDSDFMGYSPLDLSEVSVVYGHLALSENPDLCVQPSHLNRRHSAVVLKLCPQGEDSKQFLAYFKFTEYHRVTDGKTTILRYMEFLGKPNRKVDRHFSAKYSIRFDESSESVLIDGRQPNEKKGKGEKSVFSFNNKRTAK